MLLIPVTLLLAGCKQNVAPPFNPPGTTASETGVEKVKPAPGTGNVQGKVFYNSQPVENIEVKLCETFARFVGGCGGQIFTAKTDKDGDYVIANVPPMKYAALLARVFDTDTSIFATEGLAGIGAASYEVTADKTLFVKPTHLFKSDLKTTNPKSSASVSTKDLEMKWNAYPDATYYKMSIFADDPKVSSSYVNQRVDGTSLKIDKPLQKGKYRWKVEAYNGQDKKLSETTSDITFTITDG
jgi:hypothetical protein